MRIKSLLLIPVFALLVSLGVASHASGPVRVVVTIAPVHALVAGVMEGVGEPELLLPGGASPHSHSLRPSQARSLSEARLVVRVSEKLEGFLERPLRNLAGNADILTLTEIEGMTLYDAREGGLWEAHKHGEHGHDEKHDEHAHDEKHGEHGHDEHHAGHAHDEDHDPHIWLDPANARLIVNAVSAALAKAWPDHAEKFAANAMKVTARLGKLDAELETATQPLRGKSYIVFHDAYRYFDERYGLKPAGSITVSPDRPTGAKRLAQIRETIKSRGVSCVFTEPQFEPKLVQALISGTGARAGTLDPLGADIAPGPDHYFSLMRALASGMAACLKNPA